jgi:hypothetical protein
MNIKGLLISSAAAIVAVSGAQAADAIVVAEPEPMEYVRICDTYGTGYFYIPGTETCLKIGGYLRYQMNYVKEDGADYTFGKLARFAPQFTAKNQTEWGTLTSFAQVHFDWTSAAGATGTNLEHAYISLDNGSLSFLVGKTDTPFYEFLGYWAGPTIHEGVYGGTNTGQVRISYDAGNGLGFVVAAVENGNSSEFDPSIEAGVKYDQNWGWLAGAVAYDTFDEQFAARAGVGVNFTPAISASLHFMYADDDVPGMYSLYDGWYSTGAQQAEWSVLAGLSAGVTDTVTLNAHVQYFDTEEWTAAANVAWTPVNGLTITPEIAYESVTESTIGFLRFQRNF